MTYIDIYLLWVLLIFDENMQNLTKNHMNIFSLILL
jgi:hypothetical protein